MFRRMELEAYLLDSGNTSFFCQQDGFASITIIADYASEFTR